MKHEGDEMTATDVVQCWIYRSERKFETYLYVAQEATDAVPPGLLATMQPLELVMQLDLTPTRALARADVVQVIKDLRTQGFYLQMPPTHQEALNPDQAVTPKH